MSKIIPVKLRDLINEMVRLCDMNSREDSIGFYITTSVCFYGKYNLEEMINLMNNKDFNFRYGHDYLHLILYGIKNNKFKFLYNTQLKLNFDELENDGRTLLDYSKVINGNEHLKKLNYSSIQINPDIDNLILYFDEKTINSEDKKDFFPKDLLKTAVNNCYNNNLKKVKRV